MYVILAESQAITHIKNACESAIQGIKSRFSTE